MSEEAHSFVIDSLGADTIAITEAEQNKQPVLFEDKPLELEDSVASIPEVQACVTLMREAMSSMRQRKDLAAFMRKQKLKSLQLDYLKLGGRLMALSKLLKALDEHPDYYEVQEDVKDCVKSLALLIQTFEKHYKLDISAWCREHFPLTAEQKVERDAYEDTLLAKRNETVDALAGTAAYGTGDIVGNDSFAVPVPDCGNEGILVNVPDCGDEGIFAHADEVEGLLGEHVAIPDPANDHSNDAIDLDV